MGATLQGAPARAPAPKMVPAQAVTPAQVQQPRHKKGRAICIIVVICLAASFGIWTGLAWGDFSKKVDYAIPATSSAYNDITLNVAMSTSSITLTFVNPQPGDPLVRGEYNQVLRGGKMYGDYTFTYGMTDNIVTLSQTGQVWWFIGEQDISTTIYLLTNTTYTINLASSTGTVTVTIPAGTADQKDLTASTSTGNVAVTATGVKITGNVEASTSTGPVQVTFDSVTVTGNVWTHTSTGDDSMTMTGCNIGGNVKSDASTGGVNSTLTNTIVKGNFEYQAATGDVNVQFYNLTVPNDNPLLWANASTGMVNLLFEQHVDIGGNLSCAVQTSTGAIAVTYESPTSLSTTGFQASAMSSKVSSVTMHDESGFSTKSAASIQTNNFATASYTIIVPDITASTGAINVYATSVP